MAEYDYLDELDDAGWAWEFLRRSDEYRADYDRLQNPDSANSEHEQLTTKWHMRGMLDPASREAPSFYYESYESSILHNLMRHHPRQWDKFMSDNKAPRFNADTWKHSIICRDLQIEGCSLNEIAMRLYPGFTSPSYETRHHPARNRVRDDLARFKELQSKYIRIAYRQNLPL